MEKFIGTGYLLDVSTYKSKDKDENGEVILGKDGKPVLVEKTKYTFLVGDETDQGFLASPHIEVTVVDSCAPLLEEIGFMLPVKVCVSIQNKLTKYNGVWTEVPTPGYRLVGNVVEE